MYKVIDNVCKKCDICAKNKSRSGRDIGLMSKLGPAIRPCYLA